MRCPHCRSPQPGPTRCRVCGEELARPASQPLLDGLEPTHHEGVAAEAERLNDLETTEEVLGDVSIPGNIARPTEPRVCSACSVKNPPERTRCLACGERLRE